MVKLGLPFGRGASRVETANRRSGELAVACWRFSGAVESWDPDARASAVIWRRSAKEAMACSALRG